MSEHLQRAWLLVETSRWEQAEQHVRQSLAEEPNDASAHSLLAICLLEREAYEDATQAAQQAVHLAPDSDYPHFVLGQVYHCRNRLDEAATAVLEALRLDPEDPRYYWELSSIRFDQERWKDALTVAEQGLKVDSEHNGCLNMRAMALVKLGRRKEAEQSIASALARNPESAHSHANQGWTLLHQRQPKQAMEHFREALRIDPNLDWARGGMVEALKARHFFYRWLLAFFLWMGRLPSQTRWGIIVGGYVGYVALRYVSSTYPALAPWLLPFVIAYMVFAALTWIGSPLMDLFLRLNRYGRHLLSREQVITSNFIGLLTLGAIVGLVLGVIYGTFAFYWMAIVCGFSMPSIASVQHCETGWPRRAMIGIAITVFSLGMFTIALDAFEYFSFGVFGIGPLAMVNAYGKLTFIIAAFGSQWAGGFLSDVIVRR